MTPKLKGHAVGMMLFSRERELGKSWEDKYKLIWVDNLQKTEKALRLERNFTFQHDDDLKHEVRAAMERFKPNLMS